MMRWLQIVLAAGLLVSCTVLHPPAPYLPSRASIVPGETITIKGNPNVYAIAREYGVSMRDIIVLNNLQAPFALKPGQQLILPAKAGEAPSPASAPAAAIEPAPLAPIEGAPVQATPLPPLPPAANVPANPGGGNPNPIWHPSAPVEALNAPQAPPAPIATTMAPPKPEPATASPAASSPSSIDMKWPLQGPVLSAFGPKGQGLNNDGVNIGAPKGSPVTAAASGIVVYAGNEMKGFGNLVLIRHQGGWVTAYAHLDRVLVGKDAVVAQGDEIGTVGKTGNVPSPQLHFETRYLGKPVDPNTVVKGNL